MEIIPITPDGTDQADEINAAIAASSDPVVMLPEGEYLIGKAIVVPEGKTLIGAGEGVTVLKALAGFDVSPGFRTAVLLDGDGLSDLSIDVNKVYNGGTLDQRVAGVIATGDGFLVEHVSVANATGYAFWANGIDPSTPASGTIRDCRAENSNILFETSNADGVLFDRCDGADGDADIVDLGAFHVLADSNNITFQDCSYVGQAIAIDVTANGGDQANIVFSRFYGETTGPSLAAVVQGPATNNVTFIDSTIIAHNNVAVSIRNATVQASGSTFESTRIAFAVYSGIAVVTDSHATAITSADFSGATFGAYAIGTINWVGGSLAATGGPGSRAYTASVAVSGGTEVTLSGTAGNDTLVSGPGVDTLIGLGGNDSYYVNDTGDHVVEAAGEGNDAVYASVSYALAAGVSAESLAASNSATTTAINLYGNEIANTLYGNAGANRLDGGGGADTLQGLAGDDAYVIDHVGDIIIEQASAGNDIAWAKTSYALGAGASVETLSTYSHGATDAINLYGNEIANILYGNAGSNWLDGGAGADKMYGLGGNDSYVVDNLNDVVVEAAGQGNDTVWARSTYVLGAGVSVETLSTYAHGATDAINLYGNEIANTLYGNAGNNRLDGGASADVLIGLGGNDAYVIDHLNDVVVEVAGGGTDTVWARTSYVLGTGVSVETISTYAHGATDAINLYGNELANILYGNAGANRLDGGAGADTLTGFGGNDSYVVDDAGDVVVEAAGGGTDVVWARTSYALAAGASVETLSAYQHSGTEPFELVGNALANTIYGNAGANRIDGGGGADVLHGLGGSDEFVFSSPLGGGNVDRIADFQTGADKIILDLGVFGALPPEGLTEAGFHIGTGATTADQRIIYNSSTGFLSYDADGNGAGAAIQFARLNSGLAPSWTDFGVNTLVLTMGSADQAGAINAALAASTSSVVVLPEGEYLIGSAIIVPEGKTLLGAGEGLTTLKLMDGFDLSGFKTGVFLDDDSGLSGITIDVNKVNNGGTLGERIAGVIASGTGFLVEHVSVENATGYAFWANGISAATPASGIIRDCYAENSNILFETSFADGVLFERCVGADGDGDIVNLGAFHPLAGSSNITFLDCSYVGRALAIDVTANVGDQDNIVFNRFHGETTGPSVGAIIQGVGTSEVSFIDSTIIARNNVAISINNASVEAVGSTFESSRTAFAVYSGSAVVSDSHAIAVTSANFTGATYGAYAIGSISWDGGSLSATGGAGTLAYTANASVSLDTEITRGGTSGANSLLAVVGPDTLIGYEGADRFYFTGAPEPAAPTQLPDFAPGVDDIFLNSGAFAGLIAGELPANAFETGTAATLPETRILYDAATGNLLFDADGSGAAAAALFAVLQPGLTITTTDFIVY